MAATLPSNSRHFDNDSLGGSSGTIERTFCFCSEPGNAYRLLSNIPYNP